MLRPILLALLLMSEAASAGVWTCASACYAPYPNLSWNFKYLVEQAPTAKEAFDKLLNSCLTIAYKPYKGILGSSSYTYGSGSSYGFQPVQLKDVCIKDDGEAPAETPAVPANP